MTINRNVELSHTSDSISLIDVGHLSLPNDDEKIVESCLAFPSGGTVVVTGTLSSEDPQEIKVTVTHVSFFSRVPFDLLISTLQVFQSRTMYF